MDEPQVRAIFERLSGTDAPASRVDVGLARLRGRRRLRLRRAVLSGTPAVAVAVLALSASGLVNVMPHGPDRSHPATSPPPPATASFSPLIPYAEFGWLPRGVSPLTGTTGRFSQYFTAGPKANRTTWTLAVIAAGRCHPSSGQILRQLRRGGHPVLRCATEPGHAGYEWTPQRQAPSVNGHLAFWIDHQIAWEYARDSWAVVGQSGMHVPMHPRLIEKVAAGALFGAPQPALMFPVQLTGLPAGWRVGSVSFVSDAGALRGRQLVLAGAGAARTSQPMVDVSLAGPGSSCYFYPGGQSQHRTINGITAVVTRISAAPGIPATFQVCAAHAHGLSVFISTYGSEHPRAVSIFRDHLRILGPDPSRWTVQPLG